MIMNCRFGGNSGVNINSEPVWKENISYVIYNKMFIHFMIIKLPKTTLKNLSDRMF